MFCLFFSADCLFLSIVYFYFAIRIFGFLEMRILPFFSFFLVCVGERCVVFSCDGSSGDEEMLVFDSYGCCCSCCCCFVSVIVVKIAVVVVVVFCCGIFSITFVDVVLQACCMATLFSIFHHAFTVVVSYL